MPGKLADSERAAKALKSDLELRKSTGLDFSQTDRLVLQWLQERKPLDYIHQQLAKMRQAAAA